MKIDLKYPVTIDGKTYDSVTMRRAKAKDMRVVDEFSEQLTGKDNGAGAISASIALIATLSDTPLNVVEELDNVDFVRIAEHLGSFFGEPDAGAA